MERQFVEIAFRQSGELFLFDANGLSLAIDDRVVVETEHGQALGTVKFVKESGVTPPANFQLFRVVRLATDEDLSRERRHQSKEKEAFAFCNQKIIELSLPMKLIKAEYFFSGSKLLFYFSAEGRIDFRALVRDLARFFQKRIEMRQIGVRDSAKLIGGIGPCGQQLCCNRFLRQFNPVSIRMAKDQSLPLNPQKVSGVCGRLMCCLSYEQTLYQEMRKRLPRVGEKVQTTMGQGMVREVFPLQEKVRVVFFDREEPCEEEILLKDLPDFRERTLPDYIPVISETHIERVGRLKKRPRRGLEPLMEPRHTTRTGKRSRPPEPQKGQDGRLSTRTTRRPASSFAKEPVEQEATSIRDKSKSSSSSRGRLHERQSEEKGHRRNRVRKDNEAPASEVPARIPRRKLQDPKSRSEHPRKKRGAQTERKGLPNEQKKTSSVQEDARSNERSPQSQRNKPHKKHKREISSSQELLAQQAKPKAEKKEARNNGGEKQKKVGATEPKKGQERRKKKKRHRGHKKEMSLSEEKQEKPQKNRKKSKRRGKKKRHQPKNTGSTEQNG